MTVYKSQQLNLAQLNIINKMTINIDQHGLMRKEAYAANSTFAKC